MSSGLLSRLFGRRATAGSARPGATTINFMILGSRRSGTTSLEYYLGEHPEIRFLGASDLEPIGGVGRGLPFNPPFTALSHPAGRAARQYAEACASRAGQVPCIAWRPVYAMYFPHLLYNLAEQLPDLRVVFSLRDPADTTYSVWCRQGERGDTKPFEASIGLPEEPYDVPEGAPSWRRWYRRPSDVPNTVRRGMYGPYFSRVLELFPREHMHVFAFDELKRDAEATVSGILRFLGLDASRPLQRLGEVRSSSRKPEPMPASSRARLNEVFRDSNQSLFRQLGWPSDTWGAEGTDA